MSGDGTQTQALAQKPGPSVIGMGLLIAFVPIQLLVSEVSFVAIVAPTLALITGAHIGFGASAGSTTTFRLEFGVAISYAVVALVGLLWNLLALPLRLAAIYLLEFSVPELSASQRGNRRASSEMECHVLRRFWSARRRIAPCSLSPMRCVR